MKISSDFSELLRIFNAGCVQYLVVGGHAVKRYTEPRYTKGLDLWVDPARTNTRRVYEATAVCCYLALKATPQHHACVRSTLLEMPPSGSAVTNS